MFPSFPNLAEAIAAERAADLQRDAALYRRARHVKQSRARRSSVLAAHHASRSRSPQPVGRAGAGTASCQSRATSRAI
jgi:hypothetical protein